jgi:hypothetical protein
MIVLVERICIAYLSIEGDKMIKMTQAARTRRNNEKYKAAGMRQIKVWVHPGEAPEARQLVKELPLTKAAKESMK